MRRSVSSTLTDAEARRREGSVVLKGEGALYFVAAAAPSLQVAVALQQRRTMSRHRDYIRATVLPDTVHLGTSSVKPFVRLVAEAEMLL
jgi:hypothetical protein